MTSIDEKIKEIEKKMPELKDYIDTERNVLGAEFYVVKYQNNRAAYIEAFTKVINWNDVAKRL